MKNKKITKDICTIQLNNLIQLKFSKLWKIRNIKIILIIISKDKILSILNGAKILTK